ncbi:MAG: homoserine O-succinyltransferase [Rhodomicrobium sp.]
MNARRRSIIPSQAAFPKSGWFHTPVYNDLPEAELLSHGFQPVTRIESGLDIFTIHSNSLFVFFQGHPEYDSESLILEYIRDARHFIEGNRETYPDAPVGYFDGGILDKLGECQLRAARTRDPDCFTEVTRTIRGQSVQNTWRSPAEKIYPELAQLHHSGKAQAEASRRRPDGEQPVLLHYLAEPAMNSTIKDSALFPTPDERLGHDAQR